MKLDKRKTAIFKPLNCMLIEYKTMPIHKTD